MQFCCVCASTTYAYTFMPPDITLVRIIEVQFLIKFVSFFRAFQFKHTFCVDCVFDKWSIAYSIHWTSSVSMFQFTVHRWRFEFCVLQVKIKAWK